MWGEYCEYNNQPRKNTQKDNTNRPDKSFRPDPIPSSSKVEHVYPTKPDGMKIPRLFQVCLCSRAIIVYHHYLSKSRLVYWRYNPHKMSMFTVELNILLLAYARSMFAYWWASFKCEAIIDSHYLWFIFNRFIDVMQRMERTIISRNASSPKIRCADL